MYSFCDVDAPTDSEASFCGSDDDLDSDDEYTKGKPDHDELLKEPAEMEIFLLEINPASVARSPIVVQ